MVTFAPITKNGFYVGVMDGQLPECSEGFLHRPLHARECPWNTAGIQR